MKSENAIDYVTSLNKDNKAAEFRASVGVKIIESSKADKNSIIFDVGCGLGQLISELEKRDYRNITGVDSSETATKALTSSSHYAKIYCLDLERSRLPVDDNFVDIVTCLEVFEHLYNPLALLAEITRVLKPQGLAIFSFPNEYRLTQRIKYLMGQSISSPLKVGGHIKLFNNQTAIQFTKTMLLVEQVKAYGNERIRKTSLVVDAFPSLFAKWFFIIARKK